MPASACLRIVLDLSDEQFAKLDALGPLVAKVTGAFLETRWSWPKRYSPLTPFSFMLIDPKASEVDVARLERLAEELQLKLFGTASAGDVTLLLHDGDEADTARFVQMDLASLKAATQEPLQPSPLGGRFCKISTAAGASSGFHWRALDRAPATTPTAPAPGDVIGETDASFRGVYFTPRQSFVGCTVDARPVAREGSLNLVDAFEQLPEDHADEFDMACLDAGLAYMLAKPFTGVMFMPICFSSLMRRSTRAIYEQRMQALPAAKKKQLAAAVYNVPRSPSFPALTQMHEILDRHFSIIDLQITDGGFEIDNVPAGTVNSVTLRLPAGDERARLAAIHRFMDKRDSFKRRQVWPAITDVRTPAELQACLKDRTPFITGLAVCGPMHRAIGNVPCGLGQLPLQSAANC